MERVAFLIEDTGERLGCLLNPESLVVQREAGIRPRHTVGGLVSGAGLADDQLFYGGGGRTVLTLDLLFDVALAGSSRVVEDVRDLTGPIWDLAERRRGGDASAPPLCRFVWGKSWNLPGVVTAVAERLDNFTAEGVPRRSWLRLRMLRCLEPPAPAPTAEPFGWPEVPAALRAGPSAEGLVHELLGGAAADGGERLDQLAFHYYGDPALWRQLAAINGIDDPLHIAVSLLQLPPLSVLLEAP